MLTVEKFKERLIRVNHPDWMSVGVDSKDASQLYILVNGGMVNINCVPIERYSVEVKNYALEMIKQGELYLKAHEKSLRIGKGKCIYCYTVKLDDGLVKAEPRPRTIYFSSLFIRWQRTHQLSDNHAQEKLGLTAIEFKLFREDELSITKALINKLAEITGVSEQFWQNRLHQKINSK
ncbi:hypothetical protein [Pseudocolwellia agarivorans]|uniref:hypothetical protein n=1 Tax=Pseudocolwellia agarivorans TaxID=1911682 RepID=UPI003F88096E